MGSRVVLVVHRGADGTAYTRTGRRVFDEALTRELMARVDSAFEVSGLWAELDTDEVIVDSELMPWSSKAEGLIRTGYAAVGAAAGADLRAERAVLERAAGRGLDVGARLTRNEVRREGIEKFVEAYRGYVWPTTGLDGVRIAPFQILSTGAGVHVDRPHTWHLGIADRLVDADSALFSTTRRVLVDLTSAESTAAATQWWEELTARGGEGMVVKPAANGPRGKVQPGIKVRGRDYLRLIYGPDYTEPAALSALRDRNLAHKQSMALREYALGIEALQRHTAGEPLWRVHQAVFAVLALESEPVDPRL